MYVCIGSIIVAYLYKNTAPAGGYATVAKCQLRYVINFILFLIWVNRVVVLTEPSQPPSLSDAPLPI